MPPRTRIVRRAPWTERWQVNPMDFYLWLSEEIQTFDWDSKSFGTYFGLVANFIFLIARANAGRRQTIDDVFSDTPASSWVTFVVNVAIYTLIPIACANTYYTLTRTRHYRLFETNVEAQGPSTPSAHRVRVDSSPASSTPLRLIQDILGAESAESRAHPDKSRDVWEISVWDPYPATLRIFCLFSPGHLLIHWLFLPLESLDPRPSVTVFKCMVLQIILSAQLFIFHWKFSQQAKDTAIIAREVMHEYDTKYVHPRLHPVVREVGIQVSISDDHILEEEEINTGTPSTLIRRGFQTHPNPNYARLVDPDGAQSQPRTAMSPALFTPATKQRASDASFSAQLKSATLKSARQSLPSPSLRTLPGQSSSHMAPTMTSALTQTQIQSNQGLGGSLGVYTHMNSPLKKATSMGDMNNNFSPRNSREMAALEQRETAERMIRQSSPLKESRRATTQFEPNFSHSPGTLATARAGRWTQERFPSRRL